MKDEPFDPLQVGRSHDRGAVAAGSLPGGQPRQPGRLAQPCPTCDAKPGHRCRRWNPQGGYWRTLNKFHAARRARAVNTHA